MQASLGLAYGTVSATGSAGRRGSSKLSDSPFPSTVQSRLRGCSARVRESLAGLRNRVIAPHAGSEPGHETRHHHDDSDLRHSL
jgi:hypothetical protein